MGNLKKFVVIFGILLALTFTSSIRHETKYLVEKVERDELIDWNSHEILRVL